VNSIALRRLQIPLPATPYHPPSKAYFQQEFRADVSNQELIADRNRMEPVAESVLTIHDSTMQPGLHPARVNAYCSKNQEIPILVEPPAHVSKPAKSWSMSLKWPILELLWGYPYNRG